MRGSGEAPSRFAAVATLIVAGAWILTPALAIWILWAHASDATLAQPRSTWVEASEPPTSLSSDADLVLTWSEPTELLAPGWGGIVQKVYVEPTQRITNGTRICTVNNIIRVAWNTKVPLFRPIAWGDSGADVAALNDFLDAQGLPHGSGSVADWATVQGIKRYAAKIGAGRTTAVFDPSWLVYIPGEFIVDEVTELSVGAPAPAPGSIIVQGLSTLQSATLAQPNKAGDDVETSRVERIVLADGQTAWLDSQPLALADDGSVESEEVLELINQSVDNEQARLRIRVSTQVPAGAIAIPYGAIVSGVAGECVAVRRLNTVEVIPVRVVIPGSGRVYVTGELEVGEEVLVPPRGYSCETTAP